MGMAVRLMCGLARRAKVNWKLVCLATDKPKGRMDLPSDTTGLGAPSHKVGFPPATRNVLDENRGRWTPKVARNRTFG